jgi:hypothetical protein
MMTAMIQGTSWPMATFAPITVKTASPKASGTLMEALSSVRTRERMKTNTPVPAETTM